MTLIDVVGKALDFSGWKFADQVRFFGWYLHTYESKEWIVPGEVKSCFDRLGMQAPANVASFFTSMVGSQPSKMLKSKNGYKLEKRVVDEYDRKYGGRTSTVAVTAALAALPAKITTQAEREYTSEALICFKHGAFRAAIVMTWNVGYSHFLQWIFNDASRLAAFNARLAAQQNPSIKVVNSFGEFSHLKEDSVLTLARKIVTEGQYKVLKEKLDRRNAVAHPGGLVVNDVTAEEFIRDLIDNIVLTLQ